MLDVVGHEMFHGVTDHTARLEYRTQLQGHQGQKDQGGGSRIRSSGYCLAYFPVKQ